MAARWYIVHAYSNFEKKVAESIEDKARQKGLEHLFEKILVPTEKVVEVRRGRKVDSERKFFPGYVLVRANLTDEAYHLIKNTPKVTGFLGSDNKPVPISGFRGRAHPRSGSGRRRASEAFDLVRDRRAGSRLRWSVRLVQRHGSGCGRRAFAPEGRSLDLRPRDAGRAGIRSGREGLISAIGSASFPARRQCRIAWKARGLSRTSAIRTTQPQPPERSGIKGRDRSPVSHRGDEKAERNG